MMLKVELNIMKNIFEFVSFYLFRFFTDWFAFFFCKYTYVGILKMSKKIYWFPNIWNIKIYKIHFFYIHLLNPFVFFLKKKINWFRCKIYRNVEMTQYITYVRNIRNKSILWATNFFLKKQFRFAFKQIPKD